MRLGWGFFLASAFLASVGPLGAAPRAATGAGAVDYATVPLPPGSMVLRVPLNPFLVSDFLEVPVKVGAGLRMGSYEVDNQAWDACYQAGACSHPALRRKGEGPAFPVARVSWLDAEQFALWLSRVSGRRFRLPTEGEWYYAYSLGRGFTVSPRAGTGLTAAALPEAAKRTRPRGSFGRNAWGLWDLGGNVWEWTLSCYTLAQERLLNEPGVGTLEQEDTCYTRVLGGRTCASAPDFIQDDYAGGCASGEPIANMGLRLVEEVRP